ncbi:hypothetical protein E6H17_04795 [Candidatus Bathyarchaeota archaeon]|nr:MAG: hypothetical protein E6H17_04795 [Candidatus Bathyarchaeota archaeon]
MPTTVYEQRYGPSSLVVLAEFVCDRCGGQFDYNELNSQDKLVLDSSGKWKNERTYRCFDCEKAGLLGQVIA